MRQFSSFPINNPLNTRIFQKAPTVVFLKGNNDRKVSILALGEVARSTLEFPQNAFDQLKEWRAMVNDTIFGHFSYELKNDVENLGSRNTNRLQMPALCFFQAEYLVFIYAEHVEVGYFTERTTEAEVQLLVGQLFCAVAQEKAGSTQELKLNARMDRADYIRNVEGLKERIALGDIYEANLCFELFKENVEIDPIKSFDRLMELTEAPFSCYYKFSGKHTLCASPERFLKCDNGKISSQPMKGTIRRGDDQEEDEKLKLQLENDPKERSENVMIVDLVRNDLSKYAVKGSVKVEELFAVKTFRTVHQMVSTISAEVVPGTDPIDLVRSAFPMGSMTGAPKIRAMELIDQFENVQRGLYSGSIGYIDKDGNFDLNVVIRTVIYDEESKYLSIMVGSAITAASDPEKEYEECQLKAEALIQALS